MESKKKILFLIPALTGGGAQKVITTFLRNINDNRFELHLGLLRTEGPFIKDVPKTVKIHQAHSRKVLYSFLPLIKLIWKLKPFAILSTPGHLNLLVVAIRFFFPAKTRVWIREANTPSMYLNEHPRARLFKFLYRYLYRLADGVICQSSIIRDDLINNFCVPANKTVIISNPIDLQLIHQYLHNQPSPYENNNKIRLVSAGKFDKQKGFDLLIDVMAILKSKGFNAQLTLLGEGSQESVLHKKIKTLQLQENIVFAGFKNNPYPYYAHADLFILPSRWEGMSNVAIEALACGSPVVAFSSAGNIHDIIDHGINGWIIPSGDIHQMANTIIDVANKGAYKKKQDLLPEKFSAKIISKKLINSISSLPCQL